MNIILCNKNLVRFLVNKFNVAHFHIEIESKNDRHIEQCNIVVIIKYENP